MFRFKKNPNHCLNSSSGRGGSLALCQAVSLDGVAPDWVELIPAGATIKGRDGREFTNKSPEAIIDAFSLNGADLPLDWEHATELKAPKGDQAPAAAWIVEMQVREGGSIWGRIEWTRRGRQSVEEREYRYLSPSFWHGKDKNIIALANAGLTNSPNLYLTALNRSKPDIEENSMDKKILAALLGLSENASDDEITAALNSQKTAIAEASTMVDSLTTERDAAVAKLTEVEAELVKASNSAGVPQLDKYVPRADYELALNKAAAAEAKVAEQELAKHAELVEQAIAKAKADGKVAPSSEEYHRANCRTAEGLAEFIKFAASAPSVVPASGLNNATPPGAGDIVLTADQKAICKTFNMSEEDFAKAMNAQQ